MPHPENSLIDVKRYLPWMKRVCGQRLVLDQLDVLEEKIRNDHKIDLSEDIGQIKEDIARFST
tara:strand:- start:1939 stop:2127 length:189 start_codon:yes stop_codon:yes gene_type:complete